MDTSAVARGGVRRTASIVCLSALLTIATGCASQSTRLIGPNGAPPGRDADSLLIVDCLLPGQLRRLGQIMAFVTPQRPIRTTASICEIRGGEYVAYDRANFATALKTWLPKAQEGDPEAQTYVGEIYEKGLGLEPDLEVALDWYAKAAEQGFSRAQINLGFLYESGLGVERDVARAMNYYRAASGFIDAKLEYVTSVEVANRTAQKGKLVDLEVEVSRLKAANAELTRKQTGLSASQREVARLEADVDAQRARVVELARTERDAGPDGVDARLAAALAEIAELGRDLASSRLEQRRLLDRMTAQSLETGEVRRQLAAASADLSEAREEFRGRERRISRLTAEMVVLDASLASASGDEESEAQRRVQLETELTAERAAALELSAEMQRLKASQSLETREIEQRLVRAEAGEEALSRELDAQNAQVTALQTSLAAEESEHRERLASMNEQIRASMGERSELQAELLEQGREAEADASRSAEAVAELETTNTAMAAEAERWRLRVGELQRELDEADLKRANDTAGVAEKKRLASRSTELQGQLEQAIGEQGRLQERLMNAQMDARESGAGAALELARLEQLLEEKAQLISVQQSDIGRLQTEVASGRARLDQPEIEQILQVVSSGLKIEIIEPQTLLTRGNPTFAFPAGSSVLNVVGRVDPAESLLTLQMNGIEGVVNDNGVFQHKVALESGNALRVVAIDRSGERTEMSFDLLRAVSETAPAPPSPVERLSYLPEPEVFGRYHALIIGNNTYEHLQDLRTAKRDAIAVEKMLRTRYGFETELLLDADRYDLLSALNRKRDELTDRDNLLIYYAGHGELSNAKGFWMPVDAEPDNTSNWVSNSSITDLMESMRAKHIMVIADSCYSGSLTRSSLTRLRTGMTDTQQRKWFETVSALRVRTAFTSGGVKPVIDSTGDSEHSLFASALLYELGQGTGVLQAYDLFLKVQSRVKIDAKKLSVDQNPQYSPLRFAGHESGEFLFVSDDAAGRSARLSVDTARRLTLPPSSRL